MYVSLERSQINFLITSAMNKSERDGKHTLEIYFIDSFKSLYLLVTPGTLG